MTGFDPMAPLPGGAPDPWAASTMPLLRASPPYAMAEMISAEPAVARRIVGRLSADPEADRLAHALVGAASQGAPIVMTGCGTSEHAAMAGAALTADALPAAQRHLVSCVQALDAARSPQSGGVLVAVSHEGGTWATNEALKAARSSGVTTALITVSRGSPGAAVADVAIETREQDQSWCHTVGYVSPILALVAVAGRLHPSTLGGDQVAELLATDDAMASAAGAMASILKGCDRLLVVGAGIDLVSARELALKIEEGSGLPATALHLETIRHGHLAAANERTGLVAILTDAGAGARAVRERGAAVLRSAAELHMPAAAIVAPALEANIPSALTPAGRITTEQPGGIWPVAESVLCAAPPLQLLALHLAMARGRNPDPIGRDQAAQAAAAEA